MAKPLRMVVIETLDRKPICEVYIPDIVDHEALVRYLTYMIPRFAEADPAEKPSESD